MSTFMGRVISLAEDGRGWFVASVDGQPAARRRSMPGARAAAEAFVAEAYAEQLARRARTRLLLQAVPRQAGVVDLASARERRVAAREAEAVLLAEYNLFNG